MSVTARSSRRSHPSGEPMGYGCSRHRRLDDEATDMSHGDRPTRLHPSRRAAFAVGAASLGLTVWLIRSNGETHWSASVPNGLGENPYAGEFEGPRCILQDAASLLVRPLAKQAEVDVTVSGSSENGRPRPSGRPTRRGATNELERCGRVRVACRQSRWSAKLGLRRA
jgi:hypothetical protein